MSSAQHQARASANFAAKLAQTGELLQHAANDYAPRVSLACSLGAEDMVLVHLIAQLRLDIGIFVLDTGQLHEQTLALLDRLKRRTQLRLDVYTPEPDALAEFVQAQGAQAMFKSVALRQACCLLRKLEPLSRALADQDAWITGLRREQSSARAEVALIDRTQARRVKFNPLAEWSWGDVWHFIAMEGIDYNPLHDQFYPSIGCAPCTRAISLGEDLRAGRWWWESQSEGGAAQECGLHVGPPLALDRASA